MQKIKKDRLARAAKYIDGWLDFNYRDSRLPGIVVAIQHGDDLVLNRACGYANAAKKTKLMPNHIFRAASQSKTFTATAIFQLYEAKKLRLDDTVSSHLDWFDSPQDEEVAKITIRHLLNHTSGLIRDGIDANYWRLGRDFPGPQELKDFVRDSRIKVLKTNQNFKYSSYAYSYLGLVIEAASQMTYKDYITKNIIDRLGLANTHPDLPPDAESRLARGHTPILFNSPIKPVDHVTTKSLAPAAGICSTASDLCRYFSSHCHGNSSLLSDTSKREMQHGYWQTGSDGRYGLGLSVYQQGKNTLVGHGGNFPGFATDSRLDPKRQLVVSVLTNAWDGPAGFIAGRVVSIIDFFNDTAGQTQNAEKYEGRFFDAWGLMDVVDVNGKLMASDPMFWGDFEDADSLEVIDQKRLKIEEKDGFGSAGEEIIYKFEPSGKVRSVIAAGTEMLQEADYLGRQNQGGPV